MARKKSPKKSAKKPSRKATKKPAARARTKARARPKAAPARAAKSSRTSKPAPGRGAGRPRKGHKPGDSGNFAAKIRLFNASQQPATGSVGLNGQAAKPLSTPPTPLNGNGTTNDTSQPVVDTITKVVASVNQLPSQTWTSSNSNAIGRSAMVILASDMASFSICVYANADFSGAQLPGTTTPTNP